MSVQSSSASSAHRSPSSLRRLGLLLTGLLMSGVAILVWGLLRGAGPHPGETLGSPTLSVAGLPLSGPGSSGAPDATRGDSVLAALDGASQPANPDYRLEDAALLRRALNLLEAYYYNIDALTPALVFDAALQGMADGTPDALWTPAQGDVPGALMVGQRAILLDSSTIKTFNDIADTFAKIFAFYQQARVLPTDELDVEFAAIRGVLRLADRPTVLLADTRLDNFKIRSRGALSGIGSTIGNRDGQLTVLKVLEGSPSEQVGLKLNDRILRVDGESTVNVSVSEAVSRIRGMRGTWVELDVARPEVADPLHFRIMRDRIKIDNVEAARLEHDIGYVRITNFSDETLSNFRTRLDRVAPEGEGLAGLIIDLRGNGGGSLKQSAYMVDEFLSQGVIVRTEGRSEQSVRGLVREISARPPQLRPDMPLVLLVDNQTASGSEILAGALKFHNRAVLIGQRTYGKGSVQKEFPLTERASVKLTLARYLVAGEQYIQDVGIQPDITLVPVTIQEGQVHFRYPGAFRDDEDRRDDDEGEVQPVEDRDIPASRIYYLEKTQQVAEGEPSTTQLMQDFQVRFAVELLARATGASREQVLSSIQPLMAQTRQEQEGELSDALKIHHLDWHGGTDAPREASVDARLTLDSPSGLLIPGTRAKLKLELKNRSSAPLYRVRAATSSPDRLLSGLEFFFGHLAPGESRSWEIELEVPPGTSPGVRATTFQFTAGGTRLTPFETGVAVAEQPQPNLELELSYLDRAPGSPGHENRRVEPGEDVALTLWVRNSGAGSSGRLTLALRAMGRPGVELKEARASLEPLAPGEVREVGLSYLLRKDAAGEEAGPLKLTLDLLDRDFRQHIERELNFSQPWTGRMKVSPPRILLGGPLPMVTVRQERMTLTGSLSGSQGLRHLTVFRGGRKVECLLPGLQKGRSVTQFPFSIEIPLEPGANRVELRTEDDLGLVSRQQVWYRMAGS